ncbi:MAG: hypothetical protein RLY14_173 [Planctomycetota bacterium]
MFGVCTNTEETFSRDTKAELLIQNEPVPKFGPFSVLVRRALAQRSGAHAQRSGAHAQRSGARARTRFYMCQSPWDNVECARWTAEPSTTMESGQIHPQSQPQRRAEKRPQARHPQPHDQTLNSKSSPDAIPLDHQR